MPELQTINPTTEAVLDRYPTMSQADITQIIEDMEAVRQAYAECSFDKRRSLLANLAKTLLAEKNALAKLITQEMGKPITQAISEVEKCALLCDYYIEEGEDHLKPEFVEAGKKKSYRCYEPLGIIFAIMPWNFPLWQVMRFAVPNLFVGNGALLKHAPNSLGLSLAIEQLFKKAGFPNGLFRSLIIDVDLAPFVIQHPLIQGVTLTGSNRAGKAVATEAGAALKKVVMELGGSDPYIILKDADLKHAAAECTRARLSNAGQVCIAAKRIIVVESVYAAFEKLILENAKTYVMGDPLDPNTNLGPMARIDLREKIHDQVKRTIAAGARCLLGGQIPERQGFYYPPTVLVDIQPGSPALNEELFGPVFCLIKVKDEAEAIKVANDSIFGLTSVVFTENRDRGERIARDQLKAGLCSVNTMAASHPSLPFGGIKQSGIGRELSREGLHEFMNIKVVSVE